MNRFIVDSCQRLALKIARFCRHGAAQTVVNASNMPAELAQQGVRTDLRTLLKHPDVASRAQGSKEA